MQKSRRIAIPYLELFIYLEWHIPVFLNCPMQYDVNSLVSHLVLR